MNSRGLIVFQAFSQKTALVQPSVKQVFFEIKALKKKTKLPAPLSLFTSPLPLHALFFGLVGGGEGG